MKSLHDRRSAALSLVLWCAVALAAAGCTIQQVTLGAALDPPDVDTVTNGARYGEILAILGPPHKMSALPEGFVFLYEYYAPQGFQAGGRLPGQDTDFLRWLRADLGVGFARRQTVVLIFDDAGRLTRNHRLQDETEDGGAAASLSILTGAVQLADPVDVGDADGCHQWGASLLQPLGKALNRAQNLDTGQNGVQQIGTTTKVGQQTLAFD